MKTLNYILGLLVSINMLAQSPPYYYQSVFGDPAKADFIYNIMPFNSNYLVVSSISTLNTPWEIDAKIINGNNITITHNHIVLNNKSMAIYPGKRLAINSIDSSIFIAGKIYQDYYGTSAPKSQGLLWKLNKSLDTLWHKSYTNPIVDSALQFAGCIMVHDGIISYGSSNQYDYYGDIFLLKTDFNGNEISRKTFQVGNQVGLSLKLHQNKDKSLLLLQYIMYPNTDTDIKVMKLDTLFNVMWQQTYYTPYFDYQGDIIETADSNYVMCNGNTVAMLSGVMGTPVSKANLKKINKNNGAVMWDKSYGKAINFNNLLTLQEVSNKHLMAIGQKVTPYVGQKPTGATVSYILTTDANGDSLNYQTVFSDSSTSDHRLVDFCPIPDGYFFGGTTRVTGLTYEDNWLIKSDTSGCFYANCNINTGINNTLNFKENTITIYPNPAQHTVLITLPDEETTMLKLIDILGKTLIEQPLMEQQTQIDISNLPNGSYIVELKQNNSSTQHKLIINH